MTRTSAQLLDALKELGLDQNTIVMYSTDNGAEKFTWPDGGTSPFRGEKNTNWEGGYRVPTFIRWPGVIKPGTVLNDIFAHEDMLPTIMAAAGVPDVKEQLKKGMKVGNKTFKVHLDGYDITDALAGKGPGPRHEFFYFNDDGSIVGLRYDQWKIVFAEQTAHGAAVWRQPFTTLRAPRSSTCGPTRSRSVTTRRWTGTAGGSSTSSCLCPRSNTSGNSSRRSRIFRRSQKPGSFSLDNVLKSVGSRRDMSTEGIMDLDPVILSRIQFAFVISFHIIFPAFTIGLAAWLATIEGARLATGNALYRRVFDFWLKVFAVSFGMGVVTGIVMAFQFGTNWGGLAQKTGAIQGPLLGYEAFTAFMLEATFFGVMLLGRTRVSPRFYFFACCMVSLGTMFSSFWILANNSWMQVPLGHTIVDGKIIPADWWKIMLGPVMMVRWPHMLLAAFLTTGMCVAATGAWYVLRDVHRAEARVMLHWGLGFVAVIIPVQLFFGHLTGLYVLKHQPAKFAAIEARWKTAAAGVRSPHRDSRSEVGDEPFRHRDSEARQHDRLGQLDRERDRTGDIPAGRPAAGADPVLRLPPDGRDGIDHAGGVVARELPAVPRPPGDDTLVPLGNISRVPDRLRRHPHRLVHGRGRAPAVGRLRLAAHEGCGDAFPRHRRRAVFAHRLRCRLRGGLLVRHVLHLQAAARRTDR